MMPRNKVNNPKLLISKTTLVTIIAIAIIVILLNIIALF